MALKEAIRGISTKKRKCLHRRKLQQCSGTDTGRTGTAFRKQRPDRSMQDSGGVRT